jgi:hypothetical protein
MVFSRKKKCKVLGSFFLKAIWASYNLNFKKKTLNYDKWHCKNSGKKIFKKNSNENEIARIEMVGVFISKFET